ncbi:MAG: cytochrome ubiquinol oxidase subunit I [Alphaproteobacteria bacterium]|nr:cytochrome ubiquinol oxidase subunit I [Alphaproteobacteria bacterium]
MHTLDVVSLSRLQFALTALYHFLFVPLTLGMSFLLAIMESVWVMTGRTIWRDMVKFWGTLFGINFAMGVATGITMEFQFGTNWAYYSHYVGDIFGAPLAIEGLMAFFLEATFVGLFFFGWDKMSRLQHLVCTWLLALGANLSALWILIANGWMQNPVGAHFNVDTMRMEVSNFGDVLFNPVAQAKFVHTVSAGYVTGSVFIMAISAWYLLKGRHIEIAKRSMTVAACFGLASALSVVVLGDESGYTASQNQKMKIAAIEAVWHTEAAPAGLTLFGFPDPAKGVTHFEIKLPWVLGLIATRSADTAVPGIADLVERNKQRVRSGMIAYEALDGLRRDRGDARLMGLFNEHQGDLGYALLLKRYTDDVAHADDRMIASAANDTVPDVPTLFWSFRGMAALGFYFIGLFVCAFYFAARRELHKRKGFLRLVVATLPLPWLAAELGWVVAEMGRQPWTIDGVLPTFLSASSTPASNVLLSLIGFVLFYSALLVVELFLMVKYVKLGPPAAPAKGEA